VDRRWSRRSSTIRRGDLSVRLRGCPGQRRPRLKRALAASPPRGRPPQAEIRLASSGPSSRELRRSLRAGCASRCATCSPFGEAFRRDAAEASGRSAGSTWSSKPPTASWRAAGHKDVPLDKRPVGSTDGSGFPTVRTLNDVLRRRLQVWTRVVNSDHSHTWEDGWFWPVPGQRYDHSAAQRLF